MDKLCKTKIYLGSKIFSQENITDFDISVNKMRLNMCEYVWPGAPVLDNGLDTLFK